MGKPRVDKSRGTGRTSKQMQKAPQGAVFVWCNDKTWYATEFAKTLNREDLQIKPFSWLQERSVRGIDRSTRVVYDHATFDVNPMHDTARRTLRMLRIRGCLA